MHEIRRSSKGMAFGFQISNKFEGPVDLFDDAGFDLAREKANKMADAMRRMGPFEPHRLPLEEMEYTTMPEVAKKLAPRFQDI